MLTFAPIPLDELVDSPVLAGCYARTIVLDESGDITLDLVGDRPDIVEPATIKFNPIET